jgi:hypothetical protein
MIKIFLTCLLNLLMWFKCKRRGSNLKLLQTFGKKRQNNVWGNGSSKKNWGCFHVLSSRTYGLLETSKFSKKNISPLSYFFHKSRQWYYASKYLVLKVFFMFWRNCQLINKKSRDFLMEPNKDPVISVVLEAAFFFILIL